MDEVGVIRLDPAGAIDVSNDDEVTGSRLVRQLDERIRDLKRKSVMEALDKSQVRKSTARKVAA